MTNTVLYLTAFISLTTILFASACIVHLVYTKVYDRVYAELDAKYADAIERETDKLKGQNVLDYLTSNKIGESKLSAAEFMDRSCAKAVRRDMCELQKAKQIVAKGNLLSCCKRKKEKCTC